MIHMVLHMKHFKQKDWLRGVFLCVIAIIVCLPLRGQSFKLYFSNNVSDVANFGQIESDLSGLTWREVKNGDIAGNQVEVDAVKSMFASPEKKGLTQQKQFWTMRDHSLLCFRLNDGKGTSGSYEVSVDDGVGGHQSVSVSRYFYVNVPRQEEPVKIKVWSTNNEKDSISFRYFIYDWDDDNLYTFQLDSKRQLLGETYSLEYVVSYTDAGGERQVETKTLELQGKTFQSFYVHKDQTLQDVFLKNGDRKLRLNKARLHTGVTLDPDFGTTRLSAGFHLDKHENRELVNFNWIGTGLYERYDTLYVSLFNNRGKNVSKATINVESVDKDGHRSYDPLVRYDGYDRRTKTHRVVTNGKPAYLEILASGCIPAFYRYLGATDPITGIVDESRCAANIILQAGNGNNDGITLSSQHLMTLNDTKTVAIINGEDHSVCDIHDFDISLIPQADTLCFMDDAGNDWPKVLNGQKIERYARMELVYSTPRSSQQPQAYLHINNSDNGSRLATISPTSLTVFGTEFPAFTRTYFISSYDLTTHFPENICCRLGIDDGKQVFSPFPFLTRVHIDREATKKAAEEKVNNDFGGDKDESAMRGFSDSGVLFNMPLSAKLKFSPLSLKTSVVVNSVKQLLTISVKADYNRGEKDGEGKPEGESEKVTEMRKEAREYCNSIYEKDSKGRSYSAVDDSPSLDDWMAEEIDDVFDFSPQRIGVGWFGGGKIAFEIPLSKNTKEYFHLKNLSGTIGYGIGLTVPNLLDKYITGSIADILKKIEVFGIGATFEASMQLDFGLKTFNTKMPISTKNFGYFATASARIKLGAWAEVCTPANPVLFINAGLRCGGKLAGAAGVAACLSDPLPSGGVYGMAIAGISAFADVRSYFFQWAGRAGVAIGKQWYYPNNDHNPLHPDFPYWLKDVRASTVGQSYRRLPKLSATDLGTPIIEDVASNTNPHFLDEHHIVFNDLRQPNDYNDDRISIYDTESGQSADLNDNHLTATTNHNRSKRGRHEIVVYEQLDTIVDANKLQPEHAMTQSNELATHNSIMANIREEGSSWQQTVIMPSGNGFINTKPMVTIQEDGKAACVWQRGKLYTINEEISPDSLYNTAMDGSLVLSIYDGSQWSDPIGLFSIDEDQVMSQYDLVMRNDTVLIGSCMTVHPLDTISSHNTFNYASVDLATKTPVFNEDDFEPIQIFLNRVGHHTVAAMLYEKNDSTRDIFVKTLNMDGTDSGVAGSDVGANFCSPQRVKIICDRTAENLDDFAVLWTEMNNTVRGEDGKGKITDEVHTMLNASRVSLQPIPCITAPITLGSDRDSLVLGDFDGFLNDSHIKVVYSLADLSSGGAVIMQNEKYFSNSFDYDIAYTRQALLGGTTLPVNVTVRNTGTSAIHSVKAIINDHTFDIENSYVAPLRQQTFVVEYPITDGFDGYLSSQVEVTYDNVFKVSRHPRRNISLLRQQQAKEPTHVDMEDIECRLIGHTVENGVNSFLVELIDHSSRGLKSHNQVQVGIYPHPGITEPVNDQAETVVTSDDFFDFGGVRKAFATVDVPGILESANAYLNIHIVNNEHEVSNLRDNENTHYVTLLPAETVTEIEQLRQQEQSHVLHVERQENGLYVSGLKLGDTLRVFSAEGILVYRATVMGTSMFVPLSGHGVYLLGTNEEIMKYRY